MPKKARNQSSQRLKAPGTATPPASAGFDASGDADRGADSGPAASCGQQSGWSQVWPGAECGNFVDIEVIPVLPLANLQLALSQLTSQKIAQALPQTIPHPAKHGEDFLFSASGLGRVGEAYM
jgi:hypothetical protein